MVSSLITNTVYKGHANTSNNSYEFDDLNISFQPDFSLVDDMGYTDEDEFLFYVYPSDTFSDLENDLEETIINMGAPYIDEYNTLVLETDMDGNLLSFQYENCCILVCYITGMVVPEYNNTETYVNGNPYVWTLYENLTPSNPIIATATATVSNGRAVTNNIIYSEGKSRNDLIPGHSYTINAVYTENGKYNSSNGSGILEMLKCPTVTTITGTSQITVGETVTLTIKVMETQNNTFLRRGNIRVYDGENIIQNNYTITGENTNITFTPNTTGVHRISAVFTDSGVEYNSSNSNLLNINVNKKTSDIILTNESINTTLGTSIEISGVLYYDNNPISDSNISLLHYNGTVIETTTTDGNGYFSFDYQPNEVMVNKYLKLTYAGTNLISSCEKQILTNITPHNTDIQLSLQNGYINNIVDLTALLTDEHGDNVTEGSVEWTIQLG